MRRRLKINSASPLCINTRRRRAAAQFSRPRTPQESDCPNDSRRPPILKAQKLPAPNIQTDRTTMRNTGARHAGARCGYEAYQPLKGLTPLTKIGYANSSIPSPFPTKAQGAPAIEGDGSAASIEGASPLRRLALPILLSPPHSNKKRTSNMRGSYTLPEFVPGNHSFSDLA